MIGTQIGELTLIRLLGEGGMGAVYLARHRQLDALHAVKILSPALSTNSDIVTRFRNEGRATAALRHPHLVDVYDFGQLPNHGPWYMVMEYLEGKTLAQFNVTYARPVPAHMVLFLLAPAMSCMQWIHDRGVVHRDLKPENLFLTQRQNDTSFVKVLDLGIALVGDAISAGPRTKQGTVIGTPCYMAPEQLRGERVTHLADIFALGTIAYEMVTGGWFPWQRDDESRAAYQELPPTELYFRQRSAPAVDPRHRASAMNDGWATALMRTLDRDPQQRPQSDRELALLLAEHIKADKTGESGIAILKQRAPELVPAHALETLRTGKRSQATPDAQASKLRFRLGRKLGAGGMAEVFEGVLQGAHGFERPVAIKRVLAGLSELPQFVEMFVAEARISSRLNHVNVVSVVDFDKDEENRLCLVMEYVHGRDLATLLEKGPLAPSLIIYIITEMLRGLGYAHAPEAGRDGVVHRDVSPQNLLLSYEGAVKVSDFGLAKARDASGNAMSLTVRGKPSYMSPEQCNGDLLDGRSDLFAVGVMLWEMLANAPLFTGSPREVIAHIVHRDIQPPSRVRSGVAADLEAITMKLLARDREGRYPDAEAVIADLVRCQNVSRDARSELVHILAERFPEGALRTRIGTLAAAGSGGTRGQLASQFAEPTPFVTASASIPASTLQAAAAQPIGQAPSPSRRVYALIVCAVLAVFIGGALVAKGQRPQQTEPPVAATPRASTTTPAAVPASPPAPHSEIARSAGPIDAGAPVASVATPDGADADAASTAANARAPANEGSAAPAVVAVPASVDAAPHDTSSAPSGRSTSEASAKRSDRAPARPRASPIGSPADLALPEPSSSAQSAAVKRTGELAVLVKPWAMIWLNGRSVGQTPYRDAALPVGRYRLRIQNDELGKDETMTITITADQPKTIERQWP